MGRRRNLRERFDPRQLRRGTKIEFEHTDDPEIAAQIAKDHLCEDPMYYDKLALVMPHTNPRRSFHFSDCPVLAREEWTDDDVAVAMDWALDHGVIFPEDFDEAPWPHDVPRSPWTDYEPEHVREALENDTDPFVWKPEVEADFEYSGYSDYYGGHSTREGQALLYAQYGFGTTLADLVDEWMSELTMGFPGEDDPRWAGLSDEQIKKALEAIFVTPYNPDALFDEDMDEPENEEDEYESPVAIVLLTVTTGGLKDG